MSEINEQGIPANVQENNVSDQSLTESSDDIISAAERRIANLQKVITLAIRITNAKDWVNFGDRPCPGSSGATKIARLFGVCWRDLKTEKVISSDERQNFFFYKTTGLFYLKGKNDLIEASGTFSSKDDFLGTHGEKKPLSEIDETDILKGSITNCVSNGVQILLGLKNLTWEQLEAGGIKKSDVMQVKFASGGAGGGLISPAQANRLYAISKSTGKTDDQMKAILKQFGYASSKEIKRGDYDKICALAQAADEGTGVEQ